MPARQKRRLPAPVLALAIGSIATGAQAQSTLDEVVVTARKVAEPARAAPLVIDVVPAGRLVAGDVDGLASLAARVPGLSFESLWGGQGSAPVLRGLSQPSTAGDNVGVFVDGVYQASRAALNVDPFDLERIEVVRGPQSALFGQSTFAGAIHYVPRAPTATPEAGARLDVGSDALAGLQAWLSGPLGDSPWRARLAIGHREADGTFHDSIDGHSLGGYGRDSYALTLERGDEAGWSLHVSARRADATLEHPATTTLEPAAYDCGALDPVSGLWSYYCGHVPLASRFTISPDLPDSRQRTSQVALRLSSPLAPWRLEAEASYYDAHAVTIRDVDGGRAGIQLGVCRIGLTCGASAAASRPVERIVAVDVFSEGDQRIAQWTEELRLVHDPGTRLRWTLGLAAWQVRDRGQSALALARSVLNPGEQLTALLPATPLRVGPNSGFNRALVDDPVRDRAITTLSISDRDMIAAFGTWDFALSQAIALRAELRASRERELVDGVLTNSVPGLGRSIPRQSFDDLTPRVSVEWRPAQDHMGWLSLARGSRSGGVNLAPGLLAEEQGFGPEYNWTWETGLRHAGPRHALQLVAYYVDWRNVQINGFSNTPGITNLIGRNARGLVAPGLEASIAYSPTPSLQLDLAASLSEPRFRAGSEDLGSRVFCGLTVASTSTFCTVGLTRFPGSTTPILVPWVDGNRPQRAPEHMLALGASFTPAWSVLEGRLRLRLDAAWQDDGFDRAVNGARFGERTLFDARLAWSRGPWSLDLWGRNLGNDRYLVSVGPRGTGFYPTSPRPIDLIYADGRRYGLSLSWRHAPSVP